MKYFYPDIHKLHNPSIDLSDGLPGFKYMEIPQRVDAVLNGLLKAKDEEVIFVKELAVDEVKELHDEDYVNFLLEISKGLKDEDEYIPAIFREDMKNSPLMFQGGMYCKEIGTPILKNSINSALNSAKTAIEATQYMLDTDADAFALTRPPGHHAGKRRYGGYCFFNNAYLSAKLFNRYGKKVAVLDIDYHIGDGSLEFANEMAPYFSIHADPFKNYPYLDANFENRNPHVTLSSFKTKISGDSYVLEVKKLLDKAIETKADIIILSLGFDTLEGDLCQDESISVSIDNFREIGELFSDLDQRVLFLLEGGYNMQKLELCATNFISGFLI